MSSRTPELPLTALREVVREAARRAILPRFRALAAAEIATKSGPSDLVTIADIEAEALISAGLAISFPQALVAGEEGVSRDPDLRRAMGQADPVVIVDPVDGTWNFASGVAAFGVLIAVARAGVPVWGMLYDPICDDWVEASAGQPTVMRTPTSERVLRTAPEKPAEEMAGYLPLGLYPAAQRRVAVLAGLPYGRLTSLRCSAHEYRLLAQGHVDFVLSGPTPHPWDHAAGVLAVQGAGGVARFLDGGEYDTARMQGVLLAASGEAVWRRVAQDFAALA